MIEAKTRTKEEAGACACKIYICLPALPYCKLMSSLPFVGANPTGHRKQRTADIDQLGMIKQHFQELQS